MGKKPKAKHVPKFDPRNKPNPAREPKIGESPGGPANPVWRFSHMDWDGPWCPSKCEGAAVRKILERLSQFESMTWVQVKSGTGSHTVGAENIVKEARQRLTARKLDEWADHLTSLRVCGAERLWGILRGGIFYALWWDPDHQIYPSEKRNT